MSLEQRCALLNDQTIGLQSAVSELTSRNMDLLKSVTSGENQQRTVEEDRDQFKRKALEEEALIANITAEKDEIERAKTDLNTKAAELANAQAKALDSKAAR